MVHFFTSYTTRMKPAPRKQGNNARVRHTYEDSQPCIDHMCCDADVTPHMYVVCAGQQINVRRIASLLHTCVVTQLDVTPPMISCVRASK